MFCVGLKVSKHVLCCYVLRCCGQDNEGKVKVREVGGWVGG